MLNIFPLYGWTPIVLTVDHKYYPDKDFQRLNDLDCIVSRTSVLPGMRDIYLGLEKDNSAASQTGEAKEKRKLVLHYRTYARVTMSLWKKFLLNLIWLPDDRTGYSVRFLL